MSLKVVLFYNQFQRGFTETWYMPGTNPPATLPNGMDAMFKAAIQFRAGGTVLSGCRFSQTDARQATTYRFQKTYVSTQAPQSDTGEAEDVVSTTAVWRLSDNTFHSKLMYIRGLQDRDVVRDPISGADVPTAALLAALNNYKEKAIAAGMQLRYQKNPSNTPGFNNWQVTQVDKQGANVNLSVLTVALDPLGDITNGMIVGVRGIRKNDCPGLPKTFKCIIIDHAIPVTITFTYKFRNQAPVMPANAFVFKVDYSYQNLAVAEFLDFSEHKTGRPFFQPRGRASVGLRRL